MAEVTKCCNLCVTTLSHLIARCAQEAFDLLPETRRSLLGVFSIPLAHDHREKNSLADDRVVGTQLNHAVEVSDHLSMHEALIRYLQETKEEYASRLVRLTGPKLAKVIWSGGSLPAYFKMPIALTSPPLCGAGVHIGISGDPADGR